MKDKEKAIRVLAALENSTVPISWHSTNEERLIDVITLELKKISREEKLLEEDDGDFLLDLA